MRTGRVVEVRFRAGEEIEEVRVEHQSWQFLYVDGEDYVFMDSEYNQHEIEKENMGEALNYLEEGMSCEVVFYNDRPISVEIPQSVEREIEYTEPAVRGDTSGKVLKPARLKTGFNVQVPLFCATGDKIEIDTRTGEYRRRV